MFDGKLVISQKSNALQTLAIHSSFLLPLPFFLPSSSSSYQKTKAAHHEFFIRPISQDSDVGKLRLHLKIIQMQFLFHFTTWMDPSPLISSSLRPLEVSTPLYSFRFLLRTLLSTYTPISSPNFNPSLYFGL